MKTGENILELFLNNGMYQEFLLFLKENADPNTSTLNGDPFILALLKKYKNLQE